MEKIEKNPNELTDQDLQGMDQSFHEELDYSNKQALRRNTSWFLRSLMSEKKITPETKIEDLTRIIEDEQEYYSEHGGWAQYAHGVNRKEGSEKGIDDADDQARKMAGEEHEKSERVFRYCKDALAVLEDLKKEDAINDDSVLSKVQGILDIRLKRPEDRMQEEEIKRREVEKEPYEK